MNEGKEKLGKDGKFKKTGIEKGVFSLADRKFSTCLYFEKQKKVIFHDF